MPSIEVIIVRFIEEHQPGIVECEFEDASGQVHRLADKCWAFCEQTLWSDSIYPVRGAARCRVLEQWRDASDRHLAHITIAQPDGLETTEGKTEFVMLESQILTE